MAIPTSGTEGAALGTKKRDRTGIAANVECE
jgi:hypothetical protein